MEARNERKPGPVDGPANERTAYKKTVTAEDDRETTAQNRDCLWLLPLGPDQVHSRPLHRPGRHPQ